MRAKVIIIAALAGTAVLAPVFYFHFKPELTPTETLSSNPGPEVAVESEQPKAPHQKGVPSILSKVARDPHDQGLPDRPADYSRTPEDHEAYVIQRKAELTDLAMSGDSGSLKPILAELENPEPEIRQAALTAAMDTGNADAVPALRNEMNYTTDPEEKYKLMKAIEFLELPHATASSSN